MSRYQDCGSVSQEQFMFRVGEVGVRGLFGGKGTVTGTVLSGAVYKGDLLTVRGKKTKPYKVTAVSIDSDEVRPVEGTKIRLAVQGIKKKDLACGDVLCGDPQGKHCPLTDIYAYTDFNSESADPEGYFAEVFARFFPDYDVRRGGTIRSADGTSFDADFIFYRGGEPCLAIFLRWSGEWKKKEVTAIGNVCRRQGVGALTFITNFRNKADYVCDRVEKELG